MAYPAILPQLATTLVNRTALPAGLISAGFLVLNRLPAQYFNQLVGGIGDWLSWLKAAVDSGWDYDFFPDGDLNRELGTGAKRWANVNCGHVHATEVHATDVVQCDACVDASTYVAAGTYVAATTYVEAGTKVVPTAGVDVEVAGVGGALVARNLATAYVPVACGNPTVDTNALTRQFCEIYAMAVNSGDQVISTNPAAPTQLVFSATTQVKGMTLGSNLFKVSNLYGHGLYRVRVYANWGVFAAEGRQWIEVQLNGNPVETSMDLKPNSIYAPSGQFFDCLVNITDFSSDEIGLAAYQDVNALHKITYCSIEITKVTGSTT